MRPPTIPGGTAATPAGIPSNLGPRGSGPSPGGGGGTPPARDDIVLPKRKHPAHLPNVERHNQAVILFVTVCTRDHLPLLATEPMHRLIVAAWKMATTWVVGRYVLMPDHVHLFCSPTRRDVENVKKWAAYWKGLVSRALSGYGPLAHPGGTAATPSGITSNLGPGGTGPSPGGGGGTPPSRDSRAEFWQRDCWDTQLRDERHYGEKWAYVAENPVRKKLVVNPDMWPYQGELHVLRW